MCPVVVLPKMDDMIREGWRGDAPPPGGGEGVEDDMMLVCREAIHFITNPLAPELFILQKTGPQL